MAFFNAPSSTPGLRTKRSSEVRTHKPPISKPEPRFHPRFSKDHYYKHRLVPFPDSSQQNSFTQSALIFSSPTNLRSRSSQLFTNFQGKVQSAAEVSGSHMHHNQWITVPYTSSSTLYDQHLYPTPLIISTASELTFAELSSSVAPLYISNLLLHKLSIHSILSFFWSKWLNQPYSIFPLSVNYTNCTQILQVIWICLACMHLLCLLYQDTFAELYHQIVQYCKLQLANLSTYTFFSSFSSVSFPFPSSEANRSTNLYSSFMSLYI